MVATCELATCLASNPARPATPVMASPYVMYGFISAGIAFVIYTRASCHIVEVMMSRVWDIYPPDICRLLTVRVFKSCG